jgi:HEPN domain-containing protein
MPPEMPLVAEWLRKAGRDLYMAELASRDPKQAPDAWGFHCQQAAEKALKALLQFHGREVERTHDVGFLLGECLAIDPSFAPWESVAGMLTSFAVQYRSPGPADPLEDQLREANRASESLVAAVKVRVGIGAV